MQSYNPKFKKQIKFRFYQPFTVGRHRHFLRPTSPDIHKQTKPKTTKQTTNSLSFKALNSKSKHVDNRRPRAKAHKGSIQSPTPFADISCLK